jgi:hypothetical protein
MNKRDFLRTSGAAGLGLLLGEHVWARFAKGVRITPHVF